MQEQNPNIRELDWSQTAQFFMKAVKIPKIHVYSDPWTCGRDLVGVVVDARGG